MPEKIRKIKKKRRVPVNQTPDDLSAIATPSKDVTYSSLASSGGDNKVTFLAADKKSSTKRSSDDTNEKSSGKKKSRVRRSSQKREEKASIIYRRVFWTSLVCLSIVAAVFVSALLRFLYLNGSQYEEVFVDVLESQTLSEIQLKGLAVLPQTLKASELSVESQSVDAAFTNVTFSEISASHHTRGYLGLPWKTSGVESVKAVAKLSPKANFRNLDERGFNDSLGIINYSTIQISDFTLLTLEDTPIIKNSELASSEQFISIENGSLSLPLIPLSADPNIIRLRVDKQGGIEADILINKQNVSLEGVWKKSDIEIGLSTFSIATSDLPPLYQLLLGAELNLAEYIVSGNLNSLSATASVISTSPVSAEIFQDKIVTYLGYDKKVLKGHSLSLTATLSSQGDNPPMLSNLELQSKLGYSYIIPKLENGEGCTYFVKFDQKHIDNLEKVEGLIALLDKREDGYYLKLKLEYLNGKLSNNLQLLLMKNTQKSESNTEELLRSKLEELLN